jgi:hypothetical protein
MQHFMRRVRMQDLIIHRCATNAPDHLFAFLFAFSCSARTKVLMRRSCISIQRLELTEELTDDPHKDVGVEHSAIEAKDADDIELEAEPPVTVELLTSLLHLLIRFKLSLTNSRLE